MRRIIRVVWLDDNIEGDNLDKYFSTVEKSIFDFGYEVKIEKISTFDVAIEMLKNKGMRVDFFITDLNLDTGSSGIDYLKKIRDEVGYSKHVLLYSNAEVAHVKNQIKNLVDSDDLKIISNFSCVSLSSYRPENDFKEQIVIILEKWKELNALRGRIMCDNAEIEYLLRKILSKDSRTRNEDIESMDYSKLIYKFKTKIIRKDTVSKNQKLFDEWFELKDKRNALAHCEESYSAETGFYITGKSYSGQEIVIYENDIFEERKQTIQITQKVIGFLEKVSLGIEF